MPAKHVLMLHRPGDARSLARHWGTTLFMPGTAVQVLPWWLSRRLTTAGARGARVLLRPAVRQRRCH